MIVGVISDTHGLLRPEAVEALRGSQMIVHAGDVGRPEILKELREIAPVTAVRGNVDGEWALGLPLADTIAVEGAFLYVLHDLAQLDLNPVVAGIQVVISGHTHKPLIEERKGVLYLNPGSAGPRRFKLPVTLARLTVDGARVSAELIELPV